MREEDCSSKVILVGHVTQHDNTARYQVMQENFDKVWSVSVINGVKEQLMRVVCELNQLIFDQAWHIILAGVVCEYLDF